MPHPLVDQLRFTRSEFQRALAGVTDEEARRRFLPINCLSWMIGHLAAQEQFYWNFLGQGQVPVPELQAFATGQPASTPPLADVWGYWRATVAAADPYLDSLTTATLTTFLIREDGQPMRENVGTMLRRTTYHYWYHLGEGRAVRQLLGHTDLPEFVGKFDEASLYRPE